MSLVIREFESALNMFVTEPVSPSSSGDKSPSSGYGSHFGEEYTEAVSSENIVDSQEYSFSQMEYQYVSNIYMTFPYFVLIEDCLDRSIFD